MSSPDRAAKLLPRRSRSPSPVGSRSPSPVRSRSPSLEGSPHLQQGDKLDANLASHSHVDHHYVALPGDGNEDNSHAINAPMNASRCNSNLKIVGCVVLAGLGAVFGVMVLIFKYHFGHSK